MAEHGQTILVVDDDPSIRALVSRALEPAGFDVLTAATASEAVALAADLGRPLDLLATDIVLPATSGPALARQLTATQRGLPVLFLSGYGEQSGGNLDLADLGITGDVRFLAKPFGPEAIVRAVRAVLDTAGKPPLAGAS